MTAETSEVRPPGDWKSDSRLRKVAVVVCTATCTFAGHAYRLDQQRLLDTLNKGFLTKSLRVKRDFVPLTEVELFLPDGCSARRAATYIRKASILFVAERREAPPEQPEAGEKRSPIVMRRKRPIGTEVHMPLHVLAGEMHGELWQELLDTLHGEETFLPLTNVEISPALATGESWFSFVAVNKDQITYVGETSD